MKLHIVYITLVYLIFFMHNGIHAFDIYQKVIDDLQFEDPRIPRVRREKVDDIDGSGSSRPEEGNSAEELGNINENSKLLTECQMKLKLSEREKHGCLLRLEGDSTPFFKQFIRRFSEVLHPMDGDTSTLGAKILLKREQFNKLHDILQKKSSAKEILDLFIQYDVFQPLEGSSSVWREVLEKLNLPLVIAAIAAILFMLLLLVFLRRIFFQEMNWRRNLVFIIFIVFLFSIPWEWYHMYRVALSKKISISSQNIPVECNSKDITVFQGISLFFQHKFTFSDDKCVKYHESVMVDPLWEVSPLQATSVCLSRFIFEPMKLFSEAFGVSFRLLFKEIPVQWQPFIFIAFLIIIVFVIISCTGLRIESPLLKINVNPKEEIRYVQAPAVQNIPPVNQIEQAGNQQGLIAAVQLQNINAQKETSAVQDKTCAQKDTGVNLSGGVVEVNSGMLLCEAQRASDTEDNSLVASKDLPIQKKQNDENGCVGNVEDITSTSEGNKCPSENADIPAVQDEDDVSSIKFVTNQNSVDHIPDVSSLSIAERHPYIDESSGNIVVPNDSSVFSMPLHQGQSIAEISEIRRRRKQLPGNNARVPKIYQ